MEGSELKKLRKECGLSLAQASRLVSVASRTWARWEAGAQIIPDGAANLFLVLIGKKKAAEIRMQLGLRKRRRPRNVLTDREDD